MEKEKINENTMRVSLEKSDLEERGISLLDLIGNQQDVEEFFHSILDEVDTEHEFRDNGAVTFQLVPNGEGVELFITKVDPEKIENIKLPEDVELDENNSVMLSNITPEQLDEMGLDEDVTDFLKKNMQNAKQKITKSFLDDFQKNKEKSDKDNVKNNGRAKRLRKQTVAVFKFNSFENFVMMVKSINTNICFISNLFKLDEDYYFAIAISNERYTSDVINNLLSNMSEFGEVMDFAPMLLEEHGTLIKDRNAFEWVKYHFAF